MSSGFISIYSFLSSLTLFIFLYEISNLCSESSGNESTSDVQTRKDEDDRRRCSEGEYDEECPESSSSIF